MNVNSERDHLENHNLEKYKLRDFEHRHASPNKHYNPEQAFLDYLYSKKEDYPCVGDAYNAYMHKHDSSVVLFILAAIENHDLFIFDFSRQYEYEIKLTQNDLADLVEFMEEFTNNINVQKPNSEEAEDIGEKLYRILIPDELDDMIRKKYDKDEWSAWIYSKDKKYNHIWEWLYITSKTSNNTETSEVASHKTPDPDKNSSSTKKKLGFRNSEKELSSDSPVEKPKENEKQKGFFLGDVFSIIRLPKENCNFEIKRSESRINSVAILLDKSCECALSDKKCLVKLCGKSIKLSPYNLKSLHNAHIGLFDYMHIAAGIKLIKKNKVEIIQAVKKAASLNDHLFIFYNIWKDKEKCSMHNILLDVVNLNPDKAVIYTSLDVQKDFATLFAKCFYDCVLEENDVAKAVKKAREEIRNGYLFSTPNGELERALKDHNIGKLKEKFKSEHNITLSDSVIVENIAEENDIGRISDNEKTYRVKKKDGKLTIYETDRNLSLNRFWRLAYVVNANPFTAATWVRS
jgi:hypothetical protein